MADLKRVFGRQLRRCRKAKGWTQARLAEEVNMSLDMIGRLERGQAAPSLDTIGKLGEVLSVPPATLLGSVQGSTRKPLQRICEMLSEVDDADLAWVERIVAAVLSR